MPHTDSKRLADLIELDGDLSTWTDDELASVLSHQLAAPLASSLDRLDPQIVRHVAEAGGIESFGDLLTSPAPPLQLLLLTKRFAKARRHASDSGVPAEISKLLYYASIAAARLRTGQSISELADPQLGQGLRWALVQPWVQEPIRPMLERTLAILKERAG